MMNVMASVMCVLLSLFLSIGVLGQQAFQFQYLTTRDGLSNGSVSAVIKDSYGFLWIGTESGLNRYDGYGFKVYTADPEVPNTIVTNNISELQEDGLGNIWVRSGNYSVYNRQKDNFINDVPGFLEDLGIQVGRNYHVYVDKKKNLWVLSEQKIFHFDTHHKKVKEFNFNGRLDEVVSASLSDSEKYLYGVLKPGVLWQLDKKSGSQKLIALTEIENPEIYSKVYADSQGGLWLFSGKSGLVYYRKNPETSWNKLLMSSLTKGISNRVLEILDDESGHIWIGTDHNGLFIYDLINETLTNLLEDQRKKTSISSNNVVCLYRDDNGVMWIGHNKKGLSYYHKSFNSIVNVDHPECRDVSVILEDSKGNIWLGTDGNGLFVQENGVEGNIKRQPIGNNTAIVSLLEDSKGRVWIGTYLEGLFCFENGGFNRYTIQNSALISNDIWNLKEDRYGKIWIGTLAGGLQYIPQDKVNLDSIQTVNAEIRHPLDIHYDGGDKLYVGTVTGLWIVDIVTGEYSTHFQNRRGTQEFGNWTISNVYKEKNGIMWLGHSRGLTLWDLKKDTLYYFTKEKGLGDELVRGIIEDDNRDIWVTMSNGLSVLSLNRDHGDVMTVDIRNFSTGDGFKDSYFNHRAIYKLRNGDLLFGGTEGFSIVNPNKLVEKKQALAKVIFTGLSIGNSNITVDEPYNGNILLKRSMEYTDSLTFRHNDQLIAIQFAAGDLLRAEKVKYAYKLDGFNHEWIHISENKIVFSSLAPGNYRLMVKASNSDGVWNEEASMLHIYVAPPFYRSNWAIVFYILFGIGVFLFSIYRTRRHHLIRLEQQRVKLEREQEVSLNEMKLRFFTNVSHDLRTPLTLITTPLQTILEENLEDGLRQKLGLVKKNAEQLLRLINSILDFRKLDAGAESLHLRKGDYVGFIRNLCLPFHDYAIDRGLDFSFTSDPNSMMMQFDSAKIQKILLNLLSNAFKFTPSGGTVEIDIHKEGDLIFVSVKDSGPGIVDADKRHIFERFYQGPQSNDNLGSGIGLHIASEYVRMHGGAIQVKDNQPHGSIFTFSIPVIEAVEREDFGEEDLLDEIEAYGEGQSSRPQPTLLFVDDNEDFCKFMSDSLSDEFSVLLANNGQEAIEQLENQDINVVVSDVMMPVMDGTELCRRIKTNIHWSHIPVILLTARTAEEYQIEGLEVGADDYLTKPFNFNMLKLRIRKFLEWTEKCHVSFSQKMDVTPSEITITPLDQQLIEKAIHVVENHLSDPEFSVEELGSEVGLSRSHLYKKLMNITGKGPAEFIRTIRLKRGRQLLDKSQMQIAEIAYTVGFNSPKRFTINFKSEFGISPSDYLRSKKEY